MPRPGIRRAWENAVSQQSVGPGAHPVLRCADVVEAALKDVADVDPAFMPTGDKRAALMRLARVESQVKELQLGSAPQPTTSPKTRAPVTWPPG
jgi:hypothetical protein